MELLPAVLAVVAGYLVGAVSFSRIVVHLVQPGLDITRTRLVLPDDGEVIETDLVSSTAVQLRLGSRYGCLTGLLDVAKVALPVLALRLWFPDTYYYICFAAAGAVGHVWPIYYGFKGGRGLSPITGGFLVMAPVGTLVCTAVSVLVGIAARDRMLSSVLMLVLMIPWTWFTTHDWILLLYTLAMNALFLGTLVPELRLYGRLRREGRLPALNNARIEGETARADLMGDDLAPSLRRFLHLGKPAPTEEE